MNQEARRGACPRRPQAAVIAWLGRPRLRCQNGDLTGSANQVVSRWLAAEETDLTFEVLRKLPGGIDEKLCNGRYHSIF
jgi:hypothetical protein